MMHKDKMMNTVKLSEFSCVYLINVLNEVLYGFRVDYERTFGTTQDEIVRLFKKLTAICQGKALDLEALSVEEAQLLLKSSKLCLSEIDVQEFATRLGESTEAAKNINQQVSQYIEGSSPVSADHNV
jgi:hypothetical protein